MEVRSLRVLQTVERTGRIRWPWGLFALMFGELPDEESRPLLTVFDGPRNPVARRRFSTRREADDARERFVTVVSAMDDDTYATADWQAVLDRT